MSGHEDLKLRKFSKGMIQRLGLAQALINDPDLLILDEPFSGLDPIGRKDLRTLILSLREQGKTIFFSSHILQDMELMVDRVGIILDGAIRRQGRLSELISRSTQYYEVVCDHIAEKQLAQHPGEFRLPRRPVHPHPGQRRRHQPGGGVDHPQQRPHRGGQPGQDDPGRHLFQRNDWRGK